MNSKTVLKLEIGTYKQQLATRSRQASKLANIISVYLSFSKTNRAEHQEGVTFCKIIMFA